MHAAAAEIDMSAQYESPGPGKQRKEALNVRVPDSLRAMLNDVVKLWKVYAVARGDPPELIDLSFVCTRLLKQGADTAFADLGVHLIPKEGPDKGKLRPAVDSGEVDGKGRPVLTVVTASEWKLLGEAVVRVVGK